MELILIEFSPGLDGGGIVHGRATGRFMEGCGCGCDEERECSKGEGEREQEQEGQSSACHFFLPAAFRRAVLT
jgi:hypothetical protein